MSVRRCRRERTGDLSMIDQHSGWVREASGTEVASEWRYIGGGL
jgi:hypothetical protein